MFNSEFFPTPTEVIERMLHGEDIQNKVILEPSGGHGAIVTYLLDNGAKEVIAAEKHPDLRKILQTKCRVIADDFLDVKSEDVSHIDMIVMNPPFSNADTHILHAYNIAPNGCRIVAICNQETVKNTYSASRKNLGNIIENYGNYELIGDCFSDAERKTGALVALVRITKPGQSYNTEFEGFFMDDEVEEQANGIMSYNVVRDLVNRYVGAIKIYDEQLAAAVKMNNLTSGFYSAKMGMAITQDHVPKSRNDFKKEMQKSGWKFIFDKLNMGKYATCGLRDDINKFVEQQTEVPFTMKNIYRMLDIVVGTTSARMDKAIIEVFDKVTLHHHDNKFSPKGWKTNLHYLVGKKFILPYMVSPAKEYGYTSDTYNYFRDANGGSITDFEKALCYINGLNYDEVETVRRSVNRNTYGEWYTSHFFKYKGYKNGNMHFEFVSEDVWHKFNQNVARIKVYPLFEGKEKTPRQQQEFNKSQKPFQKKEAPKQGSFNVLFEMEVN